jgi:hypothetical protein
MIRQIFPSLFLIRPKEATQNIPFSYLLKRDDGNVLFATKQDLSAYTEQIRELGGAQHILLGDRHHALPATVAFARRFGAVLSASDTEAKALATHGVTVGLKLASKRWRYAPDIEIIPTPGHTRGALSYLWSHAGKRFLFIGDTLVPVNGEWQYWVTQPNRSIMRRSLEMLATVEFDVILSNSFAASPPWIELDAGSRQQLFAHLMAEFAD